MLKFILFLRSTPWTSTLAVLAAILAIVDALIDPYASLSLPLSLAAITFSILSLGR